GAGHAYLGRMGFALIAFVVIEGLYLAGVMFSHGMFLEYLPAEMRSRFAPALTPEAGNLGALLLHIKQYGYGAPFPRPWPSHMDLGTALTAISGFFNVILMSRAHFDARHPVRESGKPVGPALAAGLCWVIPGLGQFVQGRKLRGILIAVLLVGLFASACVLAEGANLDRERHFYYWAGQSMLGLSAYVAEFAHGHPLLTELPLRVDAGVVIGCVAGLLNILVMLDAYGYSEAKYLGTDPPRSAKSRAKLEAEAKAQAEADASVESKVETEVPA
ncbi:MAG TPA: hypothetical protein PLJ12_06210, partial [Planctomycetota bacterium]|nr:hypothetical protein [Planctomycetota bacterium]